MPDNAPIARTEFAWRAFIFLALAAGFFLAWQLSAILMLTFGGIVIAVVIRIAADPLAHLLHLPERWAAMLVLLVATAVIAVAAYFFGSKVTGQLDQLLERLPEGVERVTEWIGRNGGSASDSGEGQLFSFSDLWSAASTTYNVLLDAILVLLVAVYLAFSPSTYINGALRLLPPGRRERGREALRTAGQALGGWLRGQLVAMASVGVLTGVGLWLAGVPLALILGLIAGLLEFIPIIGPAIAAVPGILLAFTVGPQTALYAALIYFVVQQLETNLITPLAQRWAVQLPPALGLFGLVALGGLFGFPGLLFAAPLTVVLMELVRTLYVKRSEAK